MHFKEWKEKYAHRHVSEDMRERMKRLFIQTYEEEIEKLLLAEFTWFCERGGEDGYC
jgi:hypothetical protein